MHHSKKLYSRDDQEMQNCPCESGIQAGIGPSGPAVGDISSITFKEMSYFHGNVSLTANPSVVE